MEQQSGGDAGLGGDEFDRQLAVRVRAQHPARGVEDLRPPLVGPQPGTGARSGSCGQSIEYSVNKHLLLSIHSTARRSRCVRCPVKVVLITGASRGIGAAVARQLASEGATLALVGLEPDELKKVAEDCGPDAGWWEADVTDTDSLRTAVEAIAERYGRIDVVMANAGIAAPGFSRSMDPAVWERVLDVDLYRRLADCSPDAAAPAGEQGLPAARLVARRDRAHPRPRVVQRVQGRSRGDGQHACGRS